MGCDSNIDIPVTATASENLCSLCIPRKTIGMASKQFCFLVIKEFFITQNITTVVAEVSCIRVVSVHRVALSIHVRMYLAEEEYVLL